MRQSEDRSEGAADRFDGRWSAPFRIDDPRDVRKLGTAMRRLRRTLESRRLSGGGRRGGAAAARAAAAAVLGGFEETLLAPVARRLFAERDWRALAEFADALSPLATPHFETRLRVARALLQERRPEEAAAILVAHLDRRPQDRLWRFYAAVALLRAGAVERAAGLFREVVALSPETGVYRLQLAFALRSQASAPDAPAERRAELLAEAADEAEAAAAVHRTRAWEAWATAARCRYELRQYDRALGCAESAIEARPGVASLLFAKCQILVALNRVPEALALAREALAVDPDHEGARFQLRTLAALVDEAPGAEGSVGELIRDGDSFVLRVDGHVLPERQTSLAALARAAPCAWIAFPEPNRAAPAPALAEAVRAAPGWAGRVVLREGRGEPLEAWRLSLLEALVQSGFPDRLAELGTRLRDARDVTASVVHPQEQLTPRRAPGRGLVIRLTRHDAEDDEPFLESAAQHYEAMGYEALVAVVRPERAGETALRDGRRHVFVDGRAAALRAFFLRERPDVVHVASGLGFEAAEALDRLSIPWIYGVDFRSGRLGDDDAAPAAAEAFRYVIERAATIYSTSEEGRAALEKAFGVRTPVLRSPTEDDADRAGPSLPVDGAAGLAGVVSSLESRVLVAVGSGIGNMLHVGPMLRNMARRLGRAVDVVVAQDHADSLFLLQKAGVVNSVFSLNRQAMRRCYDVVFVTHSFGDIRPPFEGRRVIYARDWRKFEPGGPLHETVYNLEAAKELLGVDYDEADIGAHYIGDLDRGPPAERRLVGFHGGSKDGFWASKRWPHYAELARRLQARGWDCASFGLAEEHVEGTRDLTGGAIAEMAAAMRACSYVVTNDSGVMNVANALGVPLTALFGPTNPATRGPLAPTSSLIAVATDCSPCEANPSGRAVFRAGECRCIASISVDEVERHVLAEMERLGISPDGDFRPAPPAATT